MRNPKVNVPVAAKNRTHFDLSSQTITTQDFGRIDVGNVIEMVPGDKITSANVSNFIRLAPMPVPTFARCHLKTRVIFVPNRLIYKGWENFIADQLTLDFQGSKTPAIPSMRYDWPLEMMTSADVLSQYAETTNDVKKADFLLGAGTESSPATYYKLKRRGKNVKNLLEGLGYSFAQNATKNMDLWYSLLPLYAYHKAYFDWFRNPKYSSSYSPLESLFECVVSDDAAVKRAAPELFNPRFASFEQDIFSSAWESPSANYSDANLYKSNLLLQKFGKQIHPLAGVQVEGNEVIGEVDANGNIESAPYIGQYIGQYNDNVTISNVLIKSLSALDEFLKRNNIAGHRYINQLLARFGVKVPDYRLQRSELVASFDNPFQMSAIFASAAGSNGSTSTNLGDYAGIGLGAGKNTFSYEAQEHGYLLFLNYITYEPMYVQGVKPHCERLNMLDFFTPEFDNVGMRPLIYDELYSRGDFSSGNFTPTSVFGFIPQYSDYKSGMFNDRLTGDFSVRSANEGMDSYHLCRDFTPSGDNPFVAPTGVVNNEAFSYLNPAFATVNPDRIFSNNSAEFDHFYCYYNYDINISRPMSSIGESLVCGEHTRSVNMEMNGTQLG